MMVNAKEICNALLQDGDVAGLVGNENLYNAYPALIEEFPSVIVLDENQRDAEFADNMPMVSVCTVALHIFTKSIEGYPTSSEIGIAAAGVMNSDFWHCVQNGEVADPQPDVEHRIMKFTKAVFVD